MIEGKSVLAIIPARGGSKGVPGKNIADLAGKPLLGWTIEAAQASGIVDRVILSSDDAAIIEVAQSYGCDVPFVRPAELSADETPGMDVVIHALNEVPGFDLVVLLQPTSPLRTAADIDAATQLMLDKQAPAVVGVCQTGKPPEWLFYLGESQRLVPVIPSKTLLNRRQDGKSAFHLNGAVYVADVDWLMRKENFIGPETLAYEMPPERSVDIDTELDFLVASRLLSASPP